MTVMTEMSREYAEALFALAYEENAVKEYSDSLCMIADIMFENPEYIYFLAYPGIALTERLQALDDAFSGKIADYILCFMKLLCEKGHIKLFNNCVREYRKLSDASQHFTVARVTSAVELTFSEKERITAKLEEITEKRTAIEFYIDPAVIGGIIIETEGRVIDGSLRRYLQQIKDVISG